MLHQEKEFLTIQGSHFSYYKLPIKSKMAPVKHSCFVLFCCIIVCLLLLSIVVILVDFFVLFLFLFFVLFCFVYYLFSSFSANLGHLHLPSLKVRVFTDDYIYIYCISVNKYHIVSDIST